MNVLWQLNSRRGPATFDFSTWLVIVKKRGAKRIIIDDKFVRTKKFPEWVIRKRIETIILPMPAFAGLPWQRGNQGIIIGSYLMSEVMKLGSFDRLKTVLPPKSER
jgi:hypothetical protein